MPPWPSSRNRSLSAAGVLRCMSYFIKCTESLDGKTPVTFLLSQNLDIYFCWQILTRVVNFCPYQICSCPCDTKLKLIPQYSWVQAASRFYNHVPRTLLNRGYNPTFPRTTGRHFYIRCCFPKSSTKFSLQSLTPLAESTGPGESAGLYWVCAKASRASCAITEGCYTPADLVHSFRVLSNKTNHPSFSTEVFGNWSHWNKSIACTEPHKAWFTIVNSQTEGNAHNCRKYDNPAPLPLFW